MTSDIRRFAPLLAALLPIACSHTEALTSPPYGTQLPFDATPPARLTFNEASDRDPAWLPDGSGILYASQQPGRGDHDVCLAWLPPAGGRQVRITCDQVSGSPDSTDAVESPAPAVDGRLAFVSASSGVGAVNPVHEAIAVAPALDGRNREEVRALPYTVPGQPAHTHAGQLRWLAPDRLIYLGQTVRYYSLCPDCPTDTLVTGLGVAVLTLGSSLPEVLPGTANASGVAPGPDGDEVFYTLGGDSRVFRRSLASGEVTTAHDFGPAGIARDVHVAGHRLVAVVGGRVSFGTDPLLGPTQFDSGGVVHVVDLDSGDDVALEGLALFRRPVLSPAGDRIAAEGFPVTVIGTDTTVSRSGDLYLFGSP
jgi:hypothetical protein